MRTLKMGRLVSAFILAAFTACAMNVRAAQANDNSGDSSDVPAQQAQLQTKKKSKITNAKQKKSVAKAQPQHQVPDKAAQEIAQLKRQLALQQKQIEQLLHAVNQLQAQAATSPKPAAPAAASQPAPQFPSAGQLASLSPVLPVGAQSGTGSRISTDILRKASTAPHPVPAQGQKHEKLGPIASEDIKIGATFYGNFSHYSETGYAPAFQDLSTTQLAPGNDGLNTFEMTRGYINLFYSPSDKVTLRITPDIYRASDGSLTFRLKYGFVDLQKIFGNGAFKKAKLTFGQTQEPLVDWEEGLSGHRYTYLVPWNYLSLSSTYAGAKLHGPIMINGKEYLDFDIGVFNSTSFHHVETNDRKSVMGRLTFYPFGTTADRTGLGFTVFEDHGYSNTLPPQNSTPVNILSLLAHYQTHDKGYQIAFEYQLGRNAVSAGNMFSGAKPAADDPFSILAGTVLSGTHTRQQGFDVFGHARLGHSPFSLWGFYQNFQPNTNFSPSSVGLTDNPLDFTRTVGGISYKVTKHFDVAFGNQNFHWVHPQGQTGPDTNGIVIWTQFNY